MSTERQPLLRWAEDEAQDLLADLLAKPSAPRDAEPEKPRLVDFRVRRNEAWNRTLICGACGRRDCPWANYAGYGYAD